MRAIQKRYLREMLAATIAYVALIMLFAMGIPHLKVAALRIVLALLPLLPVLAMIRAMVRLLRDEDELERRIDLEAFAIASMLTGFGFFSVGLLLSVNVFTRPPAFLVAILVLPALFGSYGLAKWFVARRYANT
ncbi:MAG: hypothetical protein ACTHMK_01215 [Dyella sp.]|uniref:hypothetical protein n=1 Tax=Dyella sp. TaxID=1869338 RepID=UPI003F7D56A6